MASISTDTPNGREFTLIAALACLPFSPKTALINSEAPFIILGWSINSSDEFTNPVNFIQFDIFSKSPLHAFFAWAIIFTAQSLAASCPFFKSMSLPTLPLIKLPFESTDTWPDIYKILSIKLSKFYIFNYEI